MIKFKLVRWKNFLSTGAQFTEVKLDRSPTTLIVGENGAGKSTILDAICFSLFGKAFRNINKPQLVNSINEKHLVVEIEFDIGRKEYKIVRGVKPTIFEIYCNGELLNQDAAARDYQKYLEETILKLNYKSFTQIVILGSASFTPFMQLPASHRREVIEDILDIQIFSVMNVILKTKLSTIRDVIRDIDNKIEIGKQKVQLQQNYIKQLEQEQQKRNEDVQLQIHQATQQIQQLSETSEQLSKTLQELKESVADEQSSSAKRTELGGLLKSLSTRIKNAKDQILFYEEHDNCPTCTQTLTGELKESAIVKHTHKVEEISDAINTLNERIEALEARLDEISVIKSRMAEVQSDMVTVNTTIISNQNYIKKLQEESARVSNEAASIETAKAELKSMAKEVVQNSENKSKFKEDSYYLEAAATLLKDTGIKTKVIRQYLPVINKLVNKYLTAMDFFVSFELDEAFNETIKSRHRDDFSYASFSEGEKQRIDLALIFTWRTIAKMKNSASTNLLLLDEVFDSSLDSNGTEFVMNLLNTLGEDTSVFVISHKGDQLFDKFRSLIKFEKVQNFSRMVV
jgi:DNA repair exonuclease SbcCD ATPase subunit